MPPTEIKKEPRKRGRPPKSESAKQNVVPARQNSKKSEGTKEEKTSSIPSSSNQKCDSRTRNEKAVDKTEDTSLIDNQEISKSDEEEPTTKKRKNSKIKSKIPAPTFIKLKPEDLTNTEEPLNIELNFDINETTRQGLKFTSKLKRKNTQVQAASLVVFYEMPDSNEIAVKCMICKTYITKSRWVYHNQAIHNNLSWREGESEVDFNNREQVLSIWSTLIKKKLPLRCSNCGIKKLSSYGYYSHVKKCGKNEEEIENQKVECPICHSRLLAISLKPHIQIVHKKPNNEPREPSENVTVESPVNSSERRVAAAKALDKFKDIVKPDSVSITDLYSSKSKTDEISPYYQNLWRQQLNDNQKVHCPFIDCSFQTNDYKNMVEHYQNCSLSSDTVFYCKQCNFQNFKEMGIRDHIYAEHSDIINKKKSKKKNKDELWQFDPDSVDTDDKIISRPNNEIIQTTSSNKHLLQFSFVTKSNLSLKPAIKPLIRKWVSEFEKVNYSKFLFPKYPIKLCDWSEVSNKNNYYPRLESSISVSHLLMNKDDIQYLKKKHAWKTYTLFESCVHHDNVTTFCGGPITSLAWVPHDSTNNQYIAVSVNLNPEEFHQAGESHIKSGLIQIWDCGNLEKNKLEPSKFYFGIAHDYGIIWHMEWCPSGCYQENERLGLLATACSNGEIVIFSVPFLHQLKNNDHKIYSTKPVIKLKLQHENSLLIGKKTYQATKLVWSQMSGHNVIIGGFSNGMVALWNLDIKSSLLKTKENDVDIFYPYLSFHAHSSDIRALSVANFNGLRWLLTGSSDRNARIWDLEDIKYPIMDFKKGAITDGSWIPFWNCVVTSFDDIAFIGNVSSSINSVRDLGFKSFFYFKTKSTVKSMDCNWRINTFAQSSVSGELQVKVLKQLFLGVDNEKEMHRNSFLVSMVDWYDRTKTADEMIAFQKKIFKENTEMFLDKLNDNNDDLTNLVLNSEHEVLPTSYQESVQKMGLIFCDSPLRLFERIPIELKRITATKECLRAFPADMYPITSINKVSWNPNSTYLHCLASGFQAGFLRIHCIQLLRNMT